MLLKKKYNFYQYMVLFAISFALFTQFPNADKSALSPINTAIWFAILVLTVLFERKIYMSRYFLTFAVLLIAGTVINILLIFFQIYSSNNTFLALLPIPILVYYISFRAGKYEDDQYNWIDAILKVYFVVCSLMALQIAMTFITNFSEWNSSLQNMYEGSTHKNSTGQVIGSAFVVLFFYFKPQKLLYKIIKYGMLLIFIMALLYVQSRSAIIGIMVSIVVAAFFKKDYKSILKRLFAIAVAFLIVYNVDFLREIFEQAFYVDKYSRNGNMDLNAFSSGRLDFWKEALDIFSERFMVGVGGYYVDNFYINALACGGIVLGIPFICAYLQRIWLNIKLTWLNKHDNITIKPFKMGYYSELLGAISIFYLVVSFFEALPPYGPGVSCMFFWIMSGYADGTNKLCLEKAI